MLRAERGESGIEEVVMVEGKDIGSNVEGGLSRAIRTNGIGPFVIGDGFGTP